MIIWLLGLTRVPGSYTQACSSSKLEYTHMIGQAAQHLAGCLYTLCGRTIRAHDDIKADKSVNSLQIPLFMLESLLPFPALDP